MISGCGQSCKAGLFGAARSSAAELARHELEIISSRRFFALLDGVIYRMRSGCQWNHLPSEFGDDTSGGASAA
jgi:transposase